MVTIATKHGTTLPPPSVRITMGGTISKTRTVEVDVSDSQKAMTVISNAQHAALAYGLVGEGREDRAAVIIQRKFRGRKARRELLEKKALQLL